jgi:type IV fimbrial biogenesis protein FimT
MLVARARTRGFTLIELMIGMTIIAMLLAMGVPSFRVWIQNTKIRNAADMILTGINLARGEAVRRNTAVQFELDSESGWTVTVGGNPIQTRSAADGTDHVSVTPGGGATQVTFNGVGAVSTNEDGSASLTTVDIASDLISTSDGARPLRVTTSLAGSIRMCDPSVGTTDPRAC